MTAPEATTRDCGKCGYCDPAPSDITHFHRWAPRQCERPVQTTPENSCPATPNAPLQFLANQDGAR